MLTFFGDLWDFIRKYPKFFVPLTIIGATWWAVDFYLFHWPSHVITSYHKALASQRQLDAWSMLSSQFQTARWPRGIDQYAPLYSSFTMPAECEITPLRPNLTNLLPSLLGGTRRFEVAYDVRERFTQDQIITPGWRENFLWLQIAHPRDAVALHDGTLDENSLAIRRHFREIIVLEKTSDGWRISDIQRTMRGIKRLTD